jgi:uncharacterized protein (TIGR03083 family)
MADRVPLSRLYRGSRERLVALVTAPGVRDDTPVPATPGWTLHDVVAHLAGVAQAVVDGTVPPGPATPEWTAGHVDRGRTVATAALVARWAEHAVAVETLLDAVPVWPLVLDVGSHEQDVRAALGRPGERDGELVVIGAKVLLRGIDVPAPLTVTTEHHEVRVGPANGTAEPTRLRTTSFEVFRWRLGRRSPAQLAAMDWSADPAPLLPHLCIFGPAAADVVE